MRLRVLAASSVYMSAMATSQYKNTAKVATTATDCSTQSIGQSVGSCPAGHARSLKIGRTLTRTRQSPPTSRIYVGATRIMTIHRDGRRQSLS